MGDKKWVKAIVAKVYLVPIFIVVIFLSFSAGVFTAEISRGKERINTMNEGINEAKKMEEMNREVVIKKANEILGRNDVSIVKYLDFEKYEIMTDDAIYHAYINSETENVGVLHTASFVEEVE